MEIKSNPAGKGKYHKKRVFKQVLSIIGIILLILIGIILFLGLFPVSKNGLVSQADPASTFDESVARFEKILEQEKGITNTSTHSRLLEHGDKTPVFTC